MASFVYNVFKSKYDGSFDWVNDSIKCLLVDNTYVPDKDLHLVIADVNGEVSGSGYTTGGVSLTNKNITIDLGVDKAFYTANDIIWPNTTITPRGAVFYKDGGGLLFYIDFVEDKIVVDGFLKILFTDLKIYSIG